MVAMPSRNHTGILAGFMPHAAVRWANAKLLACCLARSERPTKRTKCDDNILLAMQRYHQAWDGVLSFLY